MGESVTSRRLVAISGLLLALMIFWGCSGPSVNTKDSEGEALEAEMRSEAPTPLYYDFEDVLVPSELKVDKKKSFVYHSQDFRAGLLVLKGGVEINSLIRFFENNMAKDNWRLVSSFKSPRTIMFFNKPNRSCIINITEKWFSTEAEIWVAPNMEPSGQGVLK